MTKLRIPVVRFADGRIVAHREPNKLNGEIVETTDEDALNAIIPTASLPIGIWWIEVDVPEVAPELNTVKTLVNYLPFDVLNPPPKTWPGSNIPLPDGSILSSTAPIPGAIDPDNREVEDWGEFEHIYDDSSTMCLKCGIPKRDVRTLEPCKGKGS